MSWGNILKAADEYNFHNKMKGGTDQMGNLMEEAKAYEPQKTLTVADLEALSLEVPVEDREKTDKNGELFKYKVVVVLDKEYRVPVTVLGDIKEQVKAKPTLKTVKVIKKGTGRDTRYTVIPLE